MLPVPPNKSSVLIPLKLMRFWSMLNKPSLAISVVGRVWGMLAGGEMRLPPNAPEMMRIDQLFIKSSKIMCRVFILQHAFLCRLQQGNIFVQVFVQNGI